MLTPLSKGQVLTFNATNGTIFTASYKCLVMFSSNVWQSTGQINKHRLGGFICILMFRQFISNAIVMDQGETLQAVGMSAPYKIIVMRLHA